MPLQDPDYRTDIERMLVYHSWSRAKYLDLFERLPWEVLVRKRGSTFESIRDVHLHVLGAYTWWLAKFFGQRQLNWILRIPESRVRSVRKMREINQDIDRAAQRVAARLGPREFDERRPVPDWEPTEIHQVTPREVFWHLIEEDFLHHGEILCMLWQDDIEPPYTGVWWFEYDHDPKRHGDLWYRYPTERRPSLGGYVTSPRNSPSRRPSKPRVARRPGRRKSSAQRK